MPRAGISVETLRFRKLREVIFEYLILPDPLTGNPLLHLEQGGLVFTFSNIVRCRLRKIHLVISLLVISPSWSEIFQKPGAESKKEG
jgi:hypothetical protein